MEKMLYFRDAADTTFCVPVSRMTKMETTNGTTVVMTFLPGNNELNTTAGGLKDIVTITLVTADTEKACMQDICKAINGFSSNGVPTSKDGFVLIADDVTGTFCSTTIASIVTTLDT
tara:strand:+ start:403 stop:753 length:351 start_codon:yes stop_codon:yes gene_type:complete